MNRDGTQERDHPAPTRSWYFWPLVGLLVGVLIGLIIGWLVWPVKWTNAYPQDLRAAERNEYLAMVAESFATNRNLELARARLATWPREELATVMADLQELALNTDAKRAADVQLLSTALNLGSAPAPAPAATPAPSASAGQPPAALALLKTVCTAALWAALALGAVALFIFLFQQWRRAYQPRGGERAISPVRGFGPGRSAAEITEEIKAQWPSERVDVEAAPDATGQARPTAFTREPELHEEDLLAEELPPFMTQREEPPVAAPQPQPVEPRRQPPIEAPKRVAPQPSTAPVRLGDFVAVYQGEDDYDEAFDINDPVDGYMGQCGLQLNSPVGRGNLAVALQVWLWDSSDPDTRVKVLMSENAYRDTGLRSEQAGEHEAIPVRPGTEFSLETHDLLLRGRVERVAFMDQEPYRGVFSDLQVKLQAFRKS